VETELIGILYVPSLVFCVLMFPLLLFFGNKFSVSLMDGSFDGLVDVLVFCIVISVICFVNVVSLIPYGVVGISTVGLLLSGLCL
jgi:hypothetical protein